MSQGPRLLVGMMSGTSLDGVDAVLVRWDAARAPVVLAHCHQRFGDELRGELLALNQSGPHELHRAALAANGIARAYAGLVGPLLAQAGVRAHEVAAIGAHGQTVRHRPGEFDGNGYTLQLLNGSLLAELTGIDVVCDFRSRDVAAGGQGAPLVPAAHRALFGRDDEAVAILNLGGIANLTGLPPRRQAEAPVTGFDTGPGNVLMDAWCMRHTGQAYDASGAWAAGGHVHRALLDHLLTEPFFARVPPKSTGRDLFHETWLDAAIEAIGEVIAPRDVQATLSELTATTAARALRRHLPNTRRLLVCGGGAFNTHLLGRLAGLLPAIPVESTATTGLPPDQVEAIAFAWLAGAFLAGEPGNLPSVTGARGPRRLGVWHPA